MTARRQANDDFCGRIEELEEANSDQGAVYDAEGAGWQLVKRTRF